MIVTEVIFAYGADHCCGGLAEPQVMWQSCPTRPPEESPRLIYILYALCVLESTTSMVYASSLYSGPNNVIASADEACCASS